MKYVRSLLGGGFLIAAVVSLMTLGPVTSCRPNNTDNGSSSPEKQSNSTETTGSNSSQTGSSANTDGGNQQTITVPDVEFTTVAGEETSLEEFRGTPLVINFWGTWCMPCRKEMPHFQKVYEKKDGQFEIIGFAVNDKLSSVKTFREKIGVTYPLVMYNDKLAKTFRNAFGPLRVFPTTYFMNADGEVVASHYSMLTPETFDKKLNKILEN